MNQNHQQQLFKMASKVEALYDVSDRTNNPRDLKKALAAAAKLRQLEAKLKG